MQVAREEQRTKFIVDLHKLTLDRFRIYKKDRLFQSNEAAFIALLERANTVLPYASLEAIYSTDAPTILTGEPGTGKTFTMKSIVPRIKGPLLVIDPHNEYSELKVNDARRIDFSKPIRARIVPSTDVYRFRGEMEGLFRDLLFEKENMGGWTILIDEAHKLFEDEIPFVKSFIIESRKFKVKVIVVCADLSLVGNIGYVLRTPPLEFGRGVLA